MRYVLLFAGLLGGVTPAFAQTPLPLFDDTVVVTANAVATDEDEVTASATVIDRREIEARQAVSVADLLATTPGVTTVTAGPPGQVTTSFVRGTESDQTLLLWNGVALNNPFFGSVSWAFLETDGVSRVEVVRGPFSALYGGSAVGGVVQVFTGALDGATLSLEGGGDGYARAGVAAGADFPTAAGDLRLDVTGHLRRGESELDNGFYDGEEGVARLAWQATPALQVGLLARAASADTGIPFSGGAPSPERRISWREQQLALPVSAQLGDWSLDGQLSTVRLDSAFRDPADPFGFTRGDTDSQAERARAVATYGGGRRWRLSLGGETERLTVTDSSTFGVNLDGARQRTWAAFGELGVDAGPVHFDLGLRRDDNDVYGAETSLRAGAVVALGAATLLRASYGEAFRPPTLGELFFPGSGNPELEPEVSRAWELGLTQRLGAWQLDLVGFEIRQDDLIDFDFATFSNVNVGRARSRGVELAVAYRGELWELRANATMLDAEDLDAGLPLLRRPEESANLVLTARPGPWTVSLVSRYVGARPDVDPVTFERATNPSSLTFDLAGRWRLSERFAPYARLENLGDEAYQPALGFPAPGRTLVGGLAVRF